VKESSMKEVHPKWLSDQIMIIDFGISFLRNERSLDIGTPKAYCAPELFFKEPRSEASDIWALGCTIFEIRTGTLLFRCRGSPTKDQVLMSVVEMLGKLPPEWWDLWEKGREWYSNKISNGGGLPQTTLGTLHRDIMEIGLHDGDREPFFLKVFGSAITKQSPPSKGLTISEVHDESTTRLVALVDELTTSEAVDVIAQVNKSFRSSESKSSSSSPMTKDGDASISPDRTLSLPENTTKTERGISSNSPPKHGSPLATVMEFLELEGTTITSIEGNDLDDLLRKAMRFLPGERLQAAQLTKHQWFSRKYESGVVNV